MSIRTVCWLTRAASYAIDIPKAAIGSGYRWLLVYLMASASRNELLAKASPQDDPEPLPKMRSLSMAISLPFSFVYSLVFSTASAPSAKYAREITSYTLASQQAMPTLAVLAIALHLADAQLATSTKARIPAIKAYKLNWPITVSTSALIGIIAFERTLHVSDFVVGAIVYFGASVSPERYVGCRPKAERVILPNHSASAVTQILHSDARLLADLYGTVATSSSASFQVNKKEKMTLLESLEDKYRKVRSTIKSILENPDSKKIYYFLCLNLAFMFIQMM